MTLRDILLWHERAVLRPIKIDGRALLLPLKNTKGHLSAVNKTKRRAVLRGADLRDSEITSNKKAIATKPLTNLYEMNSNTFYVKIQVYVHVEHSVLHMPSENLDHWFLWNCQDWSLTNAKTNFHRSKYDGSSKDKKYGVIYTCANYMMCTF